MAKSIELSFPSARKALKREDVVKMGKLLAQRAKDKDCDSLVIKVTDEKIGSIAFPFAIVDGKK